MQQVSNEYLNAVHIIRGLLASKTKKFEGIDIDPELALLAVDYLVFSVQDQEGAEIKSIDMQYINEQKRALIKHALQMAKSYKSIVSALAERDNENEQE